MKSEAARKPGDYFITEVTGIKKNNIKKGNFLKATGSSTMSSETFIDFDRKFTEHSESYSC